MLGFVAGLLALTFAFVPLDDRPATDQFPQLIAQIAGVRLQVPPAPLLGNFLTAGQPDAILAWLDRLPVDTQAFVVSNDMLAYGGLVASRIPATPQATAEARLAGMAQVRASHSLGAFSVFGTVMRLAPTGVPAIGPAANFPFAGDVWPKIQKYANLPDPPVTADDRATAQRLRSELGPTLEAYLGTRARDLHVDLQLLQYDARGAVDRVVLGQDDAGPQGLHLRDLAALRDYATQAMPYGRWSIEPGADELGMVGVAAALVRQAGLVPRVRVIYSHGSGDVIQRGIEYVPIRDTITGVIVSSGGVQVAADEPADVDLYVRVPGTSAAEERAFVDAIARDPYRAAVADLSFINSNDLADQRRLMDDLIARGVAGVVEAFASWNTTANTVGTAIPEAFAVLAGKRLNSYDAKAQLTFTYMRYVDDVLFQKVVRPQLNAELRAQPGVSTDYLLPDVAARATARDDALLRPLALALLPEIAPGARVASLAITLPWNRTFETQLQVRLQ